VNFFIADTSVPSWGTGAETSTSKLGRADSKACGLGIEEATVILSEVDEFKGMIEVSDGTMNVWD
jgi:hypothetical protein